MRYQLARTVRLISSSTAIHIPLSCFLLPAIHQRFLDKQHLSLSMVITPKMGRLRRERASALKHTHARVHQEKKYWASRYGNCTRLSSITHGKCNPLSLTHGHIATLVCLVYHFLFHTNHTITLGRALESTLGETRMWPTLYTTLHPFTRPTEHRHSNKVVI